MYSAYKLNKHGDSIQVSKEAGQVVWYSHLLKHFPQLIVIHTVKGFGIVNKAEIDVFLELSCLTLFLELSLPYLVYQMLISFRNTLPQTIRIIFG